MAIPKSEYESKVLSFIQSAIEEGDAFLQSQEGYTKIPEVMDAIFNKSNAFKSSKLSSTSVNHFGRIALDLAAGMTDVRPFWEYRTANHAFDRQINIYSKLAQHWWTQRQADMRFVDAMKYGFAAGTSYLHLVWNPDMQDIQPMVEDARDVIPIRPTSTMSIQDCMGVTVRREHTTNYIRNMYPNADPAKIRAETDGSLTKQLGNTRYARLVEKLGSPFHNWMQKTGETALQVPKIPTCSIYTTYLKDHSINEGSGPIYMGEWHMGPSKRPGFVKRIFSSVMEDEEGYCKQCEEGRWPHPRTNWSYVVQPGEKLYPNGRYIVSTNYGVLHDGPSIYWHGSVIPFPLVKLTLDPFPWSWFGKAAGWDLLPLQDSLNKALQVWDDWLAKMAQPDVIADKNSVSRAELQKINSRQAGLKIRQNPLAGKGVQIVYPDNIPNDYWTGVNFLIDNMNTISGVTSIQGLMRLNQMPSSDTIEQIMAAMSPSVRLRSKVLEAAIREFATILAYDFTQFYTLPMRLTVMGSQGVTKEDFDFDPQTFIPDYMDKGDYDDKGKVLQSAMARGPKPRYDRAKELLRQLEFHIAPGSLLESSGVTDKMMYLQLYRMGAMDLWTMLEKLGIPNIGESPGGTITERLQKQQEMGIEPQVSSVGRKSSGQQTPKQKSSGAISESG